MYLDLPNISRCCFCIPLRYGLLAWAYFKLIWCIFLTTLIGVRLSYLSTTPNALQYYSFDMIISSLYCTSLVIEFIITIVFIIGAHKKNPRLLRVYYIYVLVILAILFVLCLLAVCLVTYESFSYMRPMFIENIYEISIFGGGIILFNLYILSLVRSEIIKLENNIQFSFQNLHTEPKCTMKNNDV